MAQHMAKNDHQQTLGLKDWIGQVGQLSENIYFVKDKKYLKKSE